MKRRLLTVQIISRVFYEFLSLIVVFKILFHFLLLFLSWFAAAE